MAKDRRVLVCDDDPLLVDLLEYRLSGRGWHVDVARNGGEALRRLDEDHPDVVVLDAMMPVMDGFEVLRRMRESKRLSKIPVLMLTARRQEQDVVGALDLGASDYMVKPFIPEELVARLSKLVRGKKK